MAINHKGELIVAEAGGPCVSLFGYSGDESFIMGAPCVLFPGPLGVVTYAWNIILVAHCGQPERGGGGTEWSRHCVS